MEKSLHQWLRGPRSGFSLGPDRGVYALFLRDGVRLADIVPAEHGLLYIGLAANQNGLQGRCHFDALTSNHSPRKSLASLLLDELSLTPILVTKPNYRNTWGLDARSEARLSAWMHANLELAIELCDSPDARETELVARHTPPLNLTKCLQTAQHQQVRAKRHCIELALQSYCNGTFSDGIGMLSHDAAKLNGKQPSASVAPHGNKAPLAFPAGSETETAEAIAKRYQLDPKSYRNRLRSEFPWYRKPQLWTFPPESDEWRDMVRIAEAMSGRTR